MTTIKAFNEMMGQFLGELHATFPEEAAVKAALDAPREDRSVLDAFMASVAPSSALLSAKSEEFFQNEFSKKLDLDKIWKRPDTTPNTKEAIWQYIQTMYILGNTINMFPPETLRMIEAAAENCAQNMKSRGPGAVDEQALNTMLAQMMGGGGGLQALLGGAAQPQRRRNHKKTKK